MATSDQSQSITDRVRDAVDTSEYNRREAILGYAFAIPYIAVFIGFMLYPLLKGLYMSFYNWNPVFPSESTFIGLQNYMTLFADPLFWKSLLNTVIFAVFNVPLVVIVGMMLALGVNKNIKGRWTLRTIFFSPYILTVTVVGLVWDDILMSGGIVNEMVAWFFGQESISWMTDPTGAMAGIILATVWWTVGFNFIILLAARQNVPDRLYEAAKLDGAGPWRMLWDITIPQMKNPLIFVIILSVIGSFQVFGQPYVMTNGGPGFATTTIVLYLYNAAFQSREFGYAAAIGYVLFVILVVISIFNYYYLNPGED